MEFFSPLDKSRDGRVVSYMPAWYNENKIDDLRETIGRISRAVDRGEIPDSSVPEAKAEIARHQNKLDEITRSRPKVGDKERNLLWKFYKELGTLIQETMFSYDEMQKGTADPHEEARRMKDPIIELTPELCGLAASCGITPTGKGKNKVGRDQASRMFKMCGKLIEEPTNTEHLRPISRRVSVETAEQEIVAAGKRGRRPAGDAA